MRFSKARVKTVMPEAEFRLSLGQRAFVIAVGAAAAAWLFWLSGWLGVQPGTILLHRQNVLFNSDLLPWVFRVAWIPVEGAVTTHDAIHPLMYVLWSVPCHILRDFSALFLPPGSNPKMTWAEILRMPWPGSWPPPITSAPLYGARLVVALIAGTGVAFLAWLALVNGVGMPACAAMFVMYLLFTSNVTICLPEHFGISNGLLTAAFVAPMMAATKRTRLILLGFLSVLIGGTTATNIIFPTLSMIQSGFRSMRLRLFTLAAGAAAAAGAALVLFTHNDKFHRYMSVDMQWRFWRHPLSTGAYLFHFWVSPAVGPHPMVVPNYIGPAYLGQMVSYEPIKGGLTLHGYSGLQAVGGLAWLILLVVCGFHAWRNTTTRPPATLLLGWLLFNCAFHNIFGEELMMYAPHWSWALMALVVLGAPRVSRSFLFTAVLLIVLGQIPALLEIKRALGTITT
jgi:hypothetical protein